jgi:hypothetical protein
MVMNMRIFGDPLGLVKCQIKQNKKKKKTAACCFFKERKFLFLNFFFAFSCAG